MPSFIKVLSSCLKQPLFWILLFFLVRLYGITNPPLESAHNWRQVTGLMVARNFVEVDANILYPRVDLEGGEDRIIGMEFPLLNYLHYLLSILFGYQDWYGRLINLIVSSVGVFFFSKMLKEYLGSKIALYSSIVLICSIFFAYSRKMMPDTFSLSLAMIGGYYAARYLRDRKIHQLIFYLLFGSLAGLSKIPALLYFSPLILVIFSKEYSRNTKMLISIASLFIISICSLWYFNWNPHLEEQFGNWYNSGMSFKEGAKEILSNLSSVWHHISFHAFYSYTFFLVFTLGLIQIFKKKDFLLMRILAIYSLFALLYIVRSGFYFHHHNYYIIPLVPIMVVVIAYAIENLKWKNLGVILLIAGSIESISNQQHDFRIKDSMKYKSFTEKVVSQISDRTDKLIVVSDGNPQLLYLSHRKGWLRDPETLQKKKDLEKLMEKGAKYILVDKNEFDLQLNLEEAYQDDDFRIYSLIN